MYIHKTGTIVCIHHLNSAIMCGSQVRVASSTNLGQGRGAGERGRRNDSNSAQHSTSWQCAVGVAPASNIATSLFGTATSHSNHSSHVRPLCDSCLQAEHISTPPPPPPQYTPHLKAMLASAGRYGTHCRNGKLHITSVLSIADTTVNVNMVIDGHTHQISVAVAPR